MIIVRRVCLQIQGPGEDCQKEWYRSRCVLKPLKTGNSHSQNCLARSNLLCQTSSTVLTMLQDTELPSAPLLRQYSCHSRLTHSHKLRQLFRHKPRVRWAVATNNWWPTFTFESHARLLLTNTLVPAGHFGHSYYFICSDIARESGSSDGQQQGEAALSTPLKGCCWCLGCFANESCETHVSWGGTNHPGVVG